MSFSESCFTLMYIFHDSKEMKPEEFSLHLDVIDIVGQNILVLRLSLNNLGQWDPSVRKLWQWDLAVPIQRIFAMLYSSNRLTFHFIFRDSVKIKLTLGITRPTRTCNVYKQAGVQNPLWTCKRQSMCRIQKQASRYTCILWALYKILMMYRKFTVFYKPKPCWTNSACVTGDR